MYIFCEPYILNLTEDTYFLRRYLFINIVWPYVQRPLSSKVGKQAIWWLKFLVFLHLSERTLFLKIYSQDITVSGTSAPVKSSKNEHTS